MAASYLVLTGYDADGRPLTAERSDVVSVGERGREIHLSDGPHEHVAEAADGRWIYAARNAKGR